MHLFFLLSCATSDKGHTGLQWLDDSLSCPIEDSSFSPLSAALTCEAASNLDPVQVQNRISLDAFVTSLPITGQLTDDNGDGLINGQDTADVLIVTNNGSQSSLNLLSSDSLLSHWSSTDAEFNGVVHTPHMGTQLTVGMGELDAAVGIFGTLRPAGKSDNCYLGRWELDGTLSWIHSQTPVSCDDTFPAIIDVDADGHAEVLVDGAVISADSGSLLQQVESTGRGHGYATDLDGDGQREWLDGTALRQSNGALICETGNNEGIPVSADLDDDGDGEFVLNTEGELSWYHHDCSLGHTWSHSAGLSQPLIADIDGDGRVEIILQTESELVAFEVDGTQLWTKAISTSSPLGASAMDLDGDEIAEVAVVAENELLLIEGKTGAVRLSYVLDSIPKALPYALQLNGGGAPELVVTLSTGLWILEIDNGGIDTQNITRWHQRSCAAGMQGNGWIIPSTTPSNFAAQNSFNSSVDGTLERQFAEITPTLVDTCTDDCDLGIVTFSLSVDNTGASDIPEGVTVNVLSTSGDLLHSYTTEDELKSNHSAQFGLRVYSEEIPSDGLILSVDDSDQITECNENDNTIVISSNPCSP